ncbi:hypothetical protein LTR84_012962 [Exophiala bonariae]|uniref:JmjC domain-containing protein n=1 Tax=Exophiala bonariae TaxID=1690606 RepID=A0AAV9NFP4_9EURO|nr:hypothetical protein LTR84_012962 [Exophiala bonariae]
MDHDTAATTLIQLIEDYHDYNTGGICEYAYPTAVEFSKQVSRGRPCVYNVRRRNAQDAEVPRHMKAASDLADAERKTILSCQAFSWTAQSLCAKVPGQVEVAVTPDGRADALYRLPCRRRGHGQDGRMSGGEQDESEREGEEEREQVFVQPATTDMSLSSLLEILQPSPYAEEKTRESETPSTSTPVYYLQSQNSNLTSTPLTPLLEDLPSNLPFAIPILGEPEATNIWIGDDRSVTSTHRDPYENLYLVLRGTKTFTLYAPVEEMCLHSKMVRTGRLVREKAKQGQDDEFRIEMDRSTSFPDDDNESGESEGRDGRIPWIPISPLLSRTYLNSVFPYYKHARPQTVKVEAGQMLYLPSGWFHHVRQDCGTWDDGSRAPCIAVNYWFDMDYEGERFVVRQMIGKLADTVRDSSCSSWGIQNGDQTSH